MSKGRRNHTALHQAEFLNDEGSQETDKRIQQHLTNLLSQPPLPAASASAIETLDCTVTLPATTARYGDRAESDKAKPAAEGEYPRTPWQAHSWGNVPQNEAAEEDSDNGFSAQFVKDAVNQLATNSSGGEDGITAELLCWVDISLAIIYPTWIALSRAVQSGSRCTGRRSY